MRGLILPLATGLLVAATSPANAQLFGGGGGLFGGNDLFEDIEEMLEEFDLGEALGIYSPIDDRADLAELRVEGGTFAEAMGPLPALAFWQPLQWTEAIGQTELLMRMVEPSLADNLAVAQTTATEVRDDLGVEGVSWQPSAAKGQHDVAFLELLGPGGTQDKSAVREEVSQFVALENSANEELTRVLAEQSLALEEDPATLRAMMQETMAAEGQTQAIQQLAQMTGLMIEKFSQLQAVTIAAWKVMAADLAGEERERTLAFEQQRNFLRDKPFSEFFGVPANQLGGGGNTGGEVFVGPGV